MGLLSAPYECDVAILQCLMLGHNKVLWSGAGLLGGRYRRGLRCALTSQAAGQPAGRHANPRLSSSMALMSSYHAAQCPTYMTHSQSPNNGILKNNCYNTPDLY